MRFAPEEIQRTARKEEQEEKTGQIKTNRLCAAVLKPVIDVGWQGQERSGWPWSCTIRAMLRFDPATPIPVFKRLLANHRFTSRLFFDVPGDGDESA